MKCLSVQQPWAWLLVHGYKDVENRTWTTKLRGWVLIHAGQKMDEAAYAQLGSTLPLRSALDRGAIIGAVRIADCVQESRSPWFSGPHGFVMDRAHVFQRPVPWRGMLGFFEVDPEGEMIARQLLAEIVEGAA